MAQKERATAALQKESGTIPTTHMVLATVCNSTPRRSNALFWTLQIPVTHVVDRHADKTSVQIK